MVWRVWVILVLVAAEPLMGQVSAPASRPASAPATAPAPIRRAQLDGGRVRYAPPAGWKFDGVSKDGQTARYRSPDRLGAITINATPLKINIGPDAARQMAMTIGKGIREYAQQNGYEMVKPPRVEEDDRFLLTIHDRMRTDRGISDRIQVYRTMPGELLYVNATAFTEDEQEAAAIHEAGRSLLDRVIGGEGPRPVTFRFTRIRVSPPADWEIAVREDNPNGLVAVLREPEGGPRRLVVRSKVLPRLVRTDPQRRERFLEEMIDVERNTPPLELLTPAGDLELTQPAGALRGARRIYRSEAGTVVAETRYLAVGDGLISATAIGAEDSAEEIAALVERFAQTIVAREP